MLKRQKWSCRRRWPLNSCLLSNSSSTPTLETGYWSYPHTHTYTYMHTHIHTYTHKPFPRSIDGRYLITTRCGGSTNGAVGVSWLDNISVTMTSLGNTSPEAWGVIRPTSEDWEAFPLSLRMLMYSGDGVSGAANNGNTGCPKLMFFLVCQKPNTNATTANVAWHLYLKGCLINLREVWYVFGLTTQMEPVFAACQNVVHARVYN